MESTSTKTRQAATADEKNLDRRYGEIGIPAVAAAVRYCRPASNTACALVAAWVSERQAAAVANGSAATGGGQTCCPPLMWISAPLT
jgi:hypothetical protein